MRPVTPRFLLRFVAVSLRRWVLSNIALVLFLKAARAIHNWRERRKLEQLPERARKKVQYKAKLASQSAGVGAGAGAGLDEAAPPPLASSSSSPSPSIALDMSVPQGNHLVTKWTVLDLGLPRNKRARQSIEFAQPGRAAATPCVLDPACLPDRLRASVQTFGTQGFHCVTGWTCPGVRFRGVPLVALLDYLYEEHGFARDRWTALMQTSDDGYDVPVLREDCEGAPAHGLPPAFLALEVQMPGREALEPIPEEHGGVRVIFPNLFGWKSAKWLARVELLDAYRDGFWEKLSCHTRGRWTHNERWSSGAGVVWDALSKLTELVTRVAGEGAGRGFMAVTGWAVGFHVRLLSPLV